MAKAFNIGDRVRVEYPIDPEYHNKLGTVVGRGERLNDTTSVRFDENIPSYAAGTVCPQFTTKYLVLEYHVIPEDDELETADV